MSSDSRAAIETPDKGVRIRGVHVMRGDGPDLPPDPEFPGLRIGHADGTFEHLLTITEFDDTGVQTEIELQREEIPKAVETLIERAYPQDADLLRELVDRALEDLESDNS